MEPTIQRIGDMITQHLTPDDLAILATETGFLRRHRKVTPLAWLQVCCETMSMATLSMRLCAIRLGWLSQCVLSKQAFAKRLTSASVAFLKAVMLAEFQRQSHFKQIQEKGLFSHFNRVLLGDSTLCSLPAKLAHRFPGASNQKPPTTASAKLQAVWEFCSEKLIALDVSSYRDNDQKASLQILPLLQARDLLLRDLGYGSLKVFAAIIDKEAFFLSRYRHRVSLFHPEGTPLDLLNCLPLTGSCDQTVLVGQNDRLKLRLVARRVPQAIADKRRYKLRTDSDTRRNPTKEQLALMDWQIILTNVPPSVWKSETLLEVYGIRWRIEILFKAFKSHCHFKSWPQGNADWIETLIYARILWVLLFQVSFAAFLLSQTHAEPNLHFSLLKLIQFAQQQSCTIETTCLDPEANKLLYQQLRQHCTYEKRNKRINYQQIRDYFGLS